MRAVSRAAGDIALAVFAVLVVVGAVTAVKQGSSTSPSTVGVSLETASATPTRAASPLPSTSASARPVLAGSTVLVAGPDLADLTGELEALTGYDVVSVPAAAPEVLASGALDDVTVAPSAVVLEVLAGTKTTVRTTTAIKAVTAKWPGVQVLVVGPFSSADRKSAAAAKTATLAAKATFLDPVLLDWRTSDVSPVLTAADQTAVTAQLAAELA